MHDEKAIGIRDIGSMLPNDRVFGALERHFDRIADRVGFIRLQAGVEPFG